MKEFVDILDEAVTRLRNGDELDSVLVAFPTDAPALAPLLESAAALDHLQPVEMPQRAHLAADRYHFLEQAAQLGERRAVVSASFAGLPVSPGLLARLKTWTQKTFRWPFPARTEERQPMFALLAKIIVIAALGLGAAGGTVAAATDSLPDSALYPVKMAAEELRFALAKGPAEQAEQMMVSVQARVQEMQKLAAKGEVPSEALMNQFQHQLQTALQYAAKVGDDAELTMLLQRTRQQLREQVNSLAETQLQAQVREQAREELHLAEEALILALADMETGLVDPALYRYLHESNRPDDAPEQPEVVPAENKKQQQGPADTAPGPQDKADHEDAPVRNWSDEGPYGTDSDVPERKRETEGPYYGEPAGSGEGEPAQNQNQYQKGAAEDEQLAPTSAEPTEDQQTPGTGDPVQNQYQYGDPEAEPPAPGGEPVEPAPGGSDGGEANQNEYANQNENSQDIMSQEVEQQQNGEQESAPTEPPAEPPAGDGGKGN